MQIRLLGNILVLCLTLVFVLVVLMEIFPPTPDIRRTTPAIPARGLPS